ncbi:MAG: hypothetical protein PUD47_06050 [Bacteroidales bacterium]|nr:hypothetical protein [Bacteroidales bacterium]
MRTKMLLKHLWLIMFVITGFIMISCSDDNDSESEEEVADSTLIYGSWKYTFNAGGYQLINFHQDGTYVLEEVDDDGGHWMDHGFFQVNGNELILDIDDDDEVEDKEKYKIHKLTSSLLGIQLTHIYSYGKWESVFEGSKDEQILLFKKVNN